LRSEEYPNFASLRLGGRFFNRKFPFVSFVHFVVQIFFGKTAEAARKILERM
jgi:hypothetical protein